MKRLVASLVAVALTVLVIGIDSFREPFVVVVDVVPTGNSAFPYTARGSITGRGFYRFLVGRSRFQLMLTPGVPSVTRAQHGSVAVEVRAGLLGSERAWYVATVYRNSSTLFQKQEVLTLDHDRSQKR